MAARDKYGIDQRGFTLVELTIVMILSSLALIAMSSFFVAYYRDTLTAQQNVRLNSGFSLDAQIVSLDIRTAEAMHLRDPTTKASTNALKHPQANDWTYNFPAATNHTDPGGTAIVTYDVAKGDTPGTSALPLFMFALTTYSINSSGNPIINPATDYPYTDVIIYYMLDGSIYRRTIANTAAGASSQRITTCRNLAACGPQDAQIVEDGIVWMQQSIFYQSDLKHSPGDERYFRQINSVLLVMLREFDFFDTTFQHADVFSARIGGAAL
jgi:prepilin-type N-terminal cleavage/methylation domain-containing protein